MVRGTTKILIMKMTLKPITVWERWIPPNKNTGRRGYWAHNHIEDGHSNQERPKPKNTFQRHAWVGRPDRPETFWCAIHAFLDKDYRVVDEITLIPF